MVPAAIYAGTTSSCVKGRPRASRRRYCPRPLLGSRGCWDTRMGHDLVWPKRHVRDKGRILIIAEANQARTLPRAPRTRSARSVVERKEPKASRLVLIALLNQLDGSQRLAVLQDKLVRVQRAQSLGSHQAVKRLLLDRVRPRREDDPALECAGYHEQTIRHQAVGTPST
jgi:hypothetical protein